MQFIKNIIAPNGVAIQFHKVSRAEVGTDTMQTNVQSWPTEADYVAGKTPVWNTQLDSISPVGLSAAVQTVLDGSVEFAGATAIPDARGTLPYFKSLKWAQIKEARTAAIDAPLTTPYGVFDSYSEARSNITDAVLLAQTLAGMGQIVAIAYTLADNSVVTLDLTKMVTVGLMLGGKVQTVRGIATGLRAQIDAATTSTQLDGIVWPT